MLLCVVVLCYCDVIDVVFCGGILCWCYLVSVCNDC
jgi:hypothetical protein